MYKINKQNVLFTCGQRLFHTQDLALLWGITNKNTLYTTIKRYVKKGILFKVIKGLYSIIPISKIDKYVLGTALIHRFCYVSTQTILAKEGVINQDIIPVTFVSSISLRISFNGIDYIYRKIKPEILFDPNGIEKREGYFIATKERAISDMIYFNPKYYFDNNAK